MTNADLHARALAAWPSPFSSDAMLAHLKALLRSSEPFTFDVVTSDGVKREDLGLVEVRGTFLECGRNRDGAYRTFINLNQVVTLVIHLG